MRIEFGILVQTLLPLLCACATHVNQIPMTAEAAMPLEEYRIGRGDELSIKFFYTPELNEDVSVLPDGDVSLQLVGEVRVAGKTPAEAEEELKLRYEDIIAVRDVAVIVRKPASARVFVGGEVNRPTMVKIDGGTSLVDAIFMAGGQRDTAAMSSVVLLRPGNPLPTAYLVDVTATLEADAPLPYLQPYDVVYVPKSIVAEVGTFVDLYINRIIPRNATFGAIYNINPEFIP